MAAFPPFAEADRPLVVAHRGASRAARENTVDAFLRARALRADGVELDVRRTRDGALVVHHDAAIPGVGPLVEQALVELREVAPWVPTLEEAFDACAGAWVNVEVKNLPIDPDWDPSERVAERVARAVVDAGLHDRVIVSSFNPAALARVREVEAGIATALLVLPAFDALDAVEAAAAVEHAALHPAVEGVRDRLDEVVAAGREAGVAIVPWTVDEPEEIAALAAAGVQGIITNVPDVARTVLDRSPHRS